MVKAVRMADENVGPAECLNALQSAFGMAETGEDLYFSFRLMQQKQREKLSDFLQRLEQVLTKVIKRSGIRAVEANKARLEQLIRGAVASDLMLVQLRLRERRSNPPSFLDLLSEIHVEEEIEASWSKLKASVHTVSRDKEFDIGSKDIQVLKNEIKELKSMVATMAVATSKVTTENAVSKTKVPTPEPVSDPELASLKRQVMRLEQKLDLKKSSSPDVSAAALPVDTTRGVPKKSNDENRVNLCYQCGENGHFKASCTNAENQAKVIQWLITSLKGRGQIAPMARDKEGNNGVCTSKRSAVKTLTLSGLPNGLVGPSSLVSIKINGQLCNALLDSGSQVTIIFEDWYNKHLNNVPIQPVSGLAIWGLSDTSYQYKGYVVVNMEFPAEVTGAPEVISVLVLICPGPKSPDQIQVILGTNASLFKRLAALCKDTMGVDPYQTLGLKAIGVPEQPDLSSLAEEGVGCVQWLGPSPLTIPPSSSSHAECQVEWQHPLSDDVFMVEVSNTDPLPAGVLLQPMVVSKSAMQEKCVSVQIQNESQREVVIPVGTVMGCLHPIDPVVSVSEGLKAKKKFDVRMLNFGNSPVPEHWKRRLCKKMAERANVFSLHEWDVGLAHGIEHHIRLTDTRAFRERSRRLAPADLDDVRQHI